MQFIIRARFHAKNYRASSRIWGRPVLGDEDYINKGNGTSGFPTKSTEHSNLESTTPFLVSLISSTAHFLMGGHVIDGTNVCRYLGT